MTGYGKASATYKDKKIYAEIKSLNSKALDLSVRMAPAYREKEMELRAMIGERLLRGKVEFSLWVERDEMEQTATLNIPLMQSYIQQFRLAQEQYGIPMPENITEIVLRMPDAINKQEGSEEPEAEEWNTVMQVAHDAIEQLMEFRAKEGNALEHKFHEKVDNIEALMKSIEPYEKARTEKIRQRLVDALTTIPEVEYDRGRLEQEMIFYIEKLDINEEKQRLAHHLAVSAFEKLKAAVKLFSPGSRMMLPSPVHLPNLPLIGERTIRSRLLLPSLRVTTCFLKSSKEMPFSSRASLSCRFMKALSQLAVA